MDNPIVLTAMGLGVGALLIAMSVGIAWLLIPRFVNAYLSDLAQAIPEPKKHDLSLKAEDKAFLKQVARDL